MRAYGTIGHVYFVRQGWCIYNLAHKYRLEYDNQTKTVYVTNMRELKTEIAAVN